MFLLDTNIISELRRTDKADASLLAWANRVAPEELFVSVISILEIEIGTLRVLRRDHSKGAMLRYWIDAHVLPSFGGRILPVDARVVKICAALHVPNPRPQYDALIAATALADGLRLVTRNEKDFNAMGVQVLNPFAG
jgi:predicted nucleic acid-binding protein